MTVAVTGDKYSIHVFDRVQGAVEN